MKLFLKHCREYVLVLWFMAFRNLYVAVKRLDKYATPMARAVDFYEKFVIAYNILWDG